jgi:general L-amino acid transport system ATP-binding protein
MEQVIQLEKVNKWYDDFHVLKDIDLSVQRGQKIVVCGPSGSGKSTMIRCINRLEAHQKGHIVVHGTELTNDLKNIDMIRKNVGMVFQQFNLFPHLSVIDNISLAPIWVKKMPKKRSRRHSNVIFRKSENPRTGSEISWTVVWGSTTTSCYSKISCYEPRYNVI